MTITFWFDPGCPYTWNASRWLKDAAGRRGEAVHWRFLSLALLNEGRELPDRLRRSHAWSHRVLRSLAATDKRFGQQAVDRLYTEIGIRLHVADATYDDEVLAAAVAAADLPAQVVKAADDPGWDGVVRDSHEAAQRQVGGESGSPVVAVQGERAFFGPVLSAVPLPEAGDRLLTAVRLLSAVPEFSELKRAR